MNGEYVDHVRQELGGRRGGGGGGGGKMKVEEGGIEEKNFHRLIHVESHPNGGASTVHLYQDEIDRLLPRQQVKPLAELFFK